jgi:hypothetical protein
MDDILSALTRYENHKGATVILTLLSTGQGQVRHVDGFPSPSVEFSFTNISDLKDKLHNYVSKSDNRTSSPNHSRGP